MHLSKMKFALFVIIIFGAVFVAKIVNIISVDVSQFKPTGYKNNISEEDLGNAHRFNRCSKHTIGDKIDHLVWFMQISDIHISIFTDPTRISDFREFCSINVKAINPSLVLASGDLTDAKTVDNMGSRQFVEEWEFYKDALEYCKVADYTVWLDIRGNHDNFNVPSLDSKENFYRHYSIQGQDHIRSYMYKLKVGTDSYSFIAMDACLDPGPRRPFNFIGMLSLAEYKLLEEFDRQSWSSNFTVWFGHYPTSCIFSPDPGVRHLMRHGQVYMCGHFHTLGGLVPNMYTIHHNGMLELELGDWKDNRVYRVAAIDHGIFSFVDVPHGQWPVILVSNPKHALFTMPSKEPLAKIKCSTHIRVLVFSTTTVKQVLVSIDEGRWHNCTHVSGPLYVLPWNPGRYKHGVHSLKVSAEDSAGSKQVISQPFCLDGTRLSFGFLSRITLMSNVSLVFQTLFGIAMIICVVPICIFKILHSLVTAEKIRKPNCSAGFCNSWMRKLWVLSSVDRIFYPLEVYHLFLAIGPWVVGEMIDGKTGVVFAWGMIIGGTYIPGSFTYAYGFAQILLFNLPLTLFLAHCIDYRYSCLFNKETLCSFLCFVLHHIPFVILLCLQVMFAYFFWLAYGTMALVLGPLRTWSIVLAVILWYQANCLPRKALRSAATVWGDLEMKSETSSETNIPMTALTKEPSKEKLETCCDQQSSQE